MGSDHNSHPISASCNTGLSLGLGLNGKHHLRDKILNNNSGTDNHRQQQQPTLRFDHVVPSLSLGPVTVNDPNTIISSSPFITSTAAAGGGSSISPPNPHLLILSSSNISPGRSSSSYSNNNNNSSSFKRCSEDEVEGSVGYTNTNKVVSSSRVISDEDEEASPRKKLRLSKDQSDVLEDSFKEHSTLNPNQKQALAKQLNLRPRQVEVWFQNRRARTKLKQTEMDRELLKKCYDALTEENNKLQREIQELKALNNNTAAAAAADSNHSSKQGAPLSLCSSCERRARIAAAGTVQRPNYMSSSHIHSHGGHHHRHHVSASYNNGTASAVTSNNNPPRELSFNITTSSAAC